jgi:hypothetical protein
VTVVRERGYVRISCITISKVGPCIMSFAQQRTQPPVRMIAFAIEFRPEVLRRGKRFDC